MESGTHSLLVLNSFSITRSISVPLLFLGCDSMSLLVEKDINLETGFKDKTNLQTFVHLGEDHVGEDFFVGSVVTNHSTPACQLFS